ncbi:MAG: hypothetical protein ACR2N7_01560 [Acidimicrobiia bacterium]
MSRRLIGVATSVVVVGSLFLMAAAVAQEEPETYAACLDVEKGDLSNVAISDTPTNDCKKDEVLVSWNSEGPQGLDGLQGEKGEPGVDGADGRPGIDGIDGQNGIDGQPGPQGEQGEPGQDGADGASCTVLEDGGVMTMTCPDGASVSWIGGSEPGSSGATCHVDITRWGPTIWNNPLPPQEELAVFGYHAEITWDGFTELEQGALQFLFTPAASPDLLVAGRVQEMNIDTWVFDQHLPGIDFVSFNGYDPVTSAPLDTVTFTDIYHYHTEDVDLNDHPRFGIDYDPSHWKLQALFTTTAADCSMSVQGPLPLGS